MPMLDHEPLGDVNTLDELLGIAMALEEEAVRRYIQLADLMERRGEPDTAAVFRALTAEEEDHAAMVDGWARSQGRPSPVGPAFVWRLPPEIAASWDEVTERTRLTPYRALALAVLNEQRAFAFYSYIAANSRDETVRARAETLALEELRHAALLRRERRKAYRRERTAPSETPARADTPDELAHLAATLLSGAAAEHAGLAHRLRTLGASGNAALLDRIAEEERRLAASPSDSPRLTTPGVTPADCLRAALATCERLAEAFGDIADAATDEAVLNEALRLREAVIGHLALVADDLRALG